MATINVRLLDDDVVRDLKRRAAGNNRSLKGEVRHILEGVVRDDSSAKRDAFLTRATALRQETDWRVQTPSEVLSVKTANTGIESRP